MNCQEALNRLYDVIDKETSEIDTQQVRQHLARCKDCAGVFRVEESVNELLREKLRHQEATPRLDSLKARVLEQLDEIDEELASMQARQGTSGVSSALPVFKPGKWLAMVAAVIIVTGAGFLLNSLLNDHAAYLAWEEAHWSAAAGLDSYRGKVATTLARVETRQKFDYDITEDVGTYRLVGGLLETIDDVPVVHFVYHNEDNVVSVFVFRSNAKPIPEDLLETVVHQNGIAFYDHNCVGCRLVYHQIGGAMVVTATSNRNIDLLNFVPDRGPV